ncbi:MAG: HDIG domain-containing protein [Ignavibacteriae bacterium]|nr:HDIG domain-containing protein [Ignavibacteriota bacterium]
MAKQKTLFEQLKSAEHQESVIEKSLFSNHGVRIAFMIIIIILTGLMFPNQRAINENGEDVRQVNIGVLWMNETIKAEFPFAIIRPESEIELEKERVLKSTPIICLNIENAISEAEAKLSALLQMCEGKLLESGILNETVTKNVLEFPQQKRSMIGQIVQKYREELISTYYERRPLISVAISSLSDTVFIRKSKGIDMPMLKSAFSDTTLMRGQLSELFADKLQMQEVEKVVSTLIEILKPKYEVSKSLTQETKSNRLASIPRTLGIVRAGEVLIRKGERFDRLSALKVQSYVSNRGNSDTSTYSWSILLGSIGHSFLIFSMMILYLFFIRPVIFAHHQQLYGLLGIVLIAPIFSWITVFMNSSYPLEYAVIVPALSMLIAILFDSRTAFYSTVVMSLLIAGVRGSDYSVGLAMMIGGMVAAYSVRDIQARTQLFASITYVFIGMSVSIASIGAERSLSWNEMYPQLIVAGINAVFSPIFTFGVLYLIERVFPVTTDLKIDEYDSLEHPLLMEMNEKAPGTFQHTMTIARLAESAAHAIHANALLAKVGSLYHDIGKIPKAEYYVENQINIDNKHNHLPPKKSASIIKEHVHDGIELAKEYKLPQRIIDFIPMHHGTMLVKHFYAKAIELSQKGEGPTIVKEEDYRYTGPKPNSKETGILMLADAAEAVVRLNNAETKEDIEVILQGIINDRMLDGQLDECPLTIAEINEIKESFIKNLLGMRHHRITYKEIPDKK